MKEETEEKENKKNKKNKVKALTIISIIAIIAIIITFYFIVNAKLKNDEKQVAENIETDNKTEIETKNEYALSSNNLSKFDLSFLKYENDKTNKIYSPLSMKYALKMLEEATEGDAKKQIADIIGDYKITDYNANTKMGFANAFFIRDSFKESVKQDYMDLIKLRYKADVTFDDFTTAKNLNNWVKKNTLGLIDNLYSDDDMQQLTFALVNALAIDMNWEHKFLEYYYEDDKNITSDVKYNHENVEWYTVKELYKLKYNNDQNVSSMRVIATLNNYDIIKDLGEDKIKEIVKKDFLNCYKRGDFDSYSSDKSYYFGNDYSDAGIEKGFEKYWTGELYSDDKSYIEEIKENYKKVDYSTDFSIYVDDNVKVFAKDLEKSEGTTLQYIGIMPKEENLDSFIEKNSEEDINKLISNLKELKLENFKDGVLTKITGYIPKFKFDYELNLVEDMKKLGVTDVFEQGKANLKNMTDNENIFITDLKQKANIEFTQDGIKAAAATVQGGAGGGYGYDYIFDIPTEEIDITFDKPYMYIIRDKDTGEIWFTGTVYNPLDASDDTSEYVDIIRD